MPEPNTLALPQQLKYGTLSVRNPDRDCAYLHRLWALYKGGNALLGNRALLESLFPPHKREIPSVYNERLKCAFYIGIAGEIVDYLKATLTSDPVRVGQEKPGESLVQLEGWYLKWVADVTPKGAPVCDLGQFLREAVLNLLVTNESWVRVDLPAPGDYTSLSDQERAGALDAWAINVPTECVWDWREDADGALKWAIIHSRETPRETIADARDKVIERWTWYDRDQVAEYKLEYPANKEPTENQMVPLASLKPHKFGVVPLVRKKLPHGLWAMDTLESTQREHFNKRNALAWAERQSLLPELYEFMGPEQSSGAAVIGENQKNANRAVDQPRGQGYVQERGADDRAEFVGPAVEPFGEARKSCQELRDEMHRVMHLMALSVSNTSSMMGRSAASKAQDNASTNIVAGELGKNLREHAVEIMKMVSRARGDAAMQDKWKAQGAATFVVTGADDVIDRAEKLEGITVKSKTFHVLHQKAVAEAALGDDASPAVMTQIEDELEANITDEDMGPMETRETVDIGEPMGDDFEAEDDSDEDEDKPKTKLKDAAKSTGKQPRKRTAAGK